MDRIKAAELVAGKRYIAFAPNGEEILGTYEKVTARAEISFFMKGGELLSSGASMDHDVDYQHQGETEVFWDGQETVVQERPGEEEWVVYLCRAGEAWTSDQLVFEEI